jgi:hypothetical protein
MKMNYNESRESVSSYFFEYTSYLVFMARQIIGQESPYGSFALIKALEKILVLPEMIKEIDDKDFYNSIRAELESMRGTSSGEIEKWCSFLDRLVKIYTAKMKMAEGKVPT